LFFDGRVPLAGEDVAELHREVVGRGVEQAFVVASLAAFASLDHEPGAAQRVQMPVERVGGAVDHFGKLGGRARADAAKSLRDLASHR